MVRITDLDYHLGSDLTDKICAMAHKMRQTGVNSQLQSKLSQLEQIVIDQADPFNSFKWQLYEDTFLCLLPNDNIVVYEGWQRDFYDLYPDPESDDDYCITTCHEYIMLIEGRLSANKFLPERVYYEDEYGVSTNAQHLLANRPGNWEIDFPGTYEFDFTYRSDKKWTYPHFICDTLCHMRCKVEYEDNDDGSDDVYFRLLRR